MNIKSRSNRLRSIHFWMPGLFDFKGGIQVYSAFLLKAFQDLYPEAKYNIFLKNDTSSTLHPTFSPLSKTQLHFYGNLPLPLKTLLFAAQVMAKGIFGKPDLVFAAHLNFTLAAYWLKQLTGVPYWTVVYGMEAWNIKNPMLKKALDHADRILCISCYTRDRLIEEQGLEKTKFSLLPCTFDQSRFRISSKPNHLLKKYSLESDQSIILTVSRLAGTERYKGYDQILQALPKIRQVIPNVHYIIAGKGDDQPRIEKLIQELQLENSVTLAGFVPDEQISNYYNLCDVFTMPSKKEGFGIVYLEALACGKPTIGGNQDGAIDALCHGKLGALVDPDNVDEIAETVIQILQGSYPNPLMYQPEALRHKVIEAFGFERFQETLAEILHNY